MLPDLAGFPYRLSIHEIATGMPNDGNYNSFGAATYLWSVNREDGANN